MQYMHQNPLNLRHIVAYALGGTTALLMARVLLRLFAARPDNPIVAGLFAITAPPPVLALLDAGQPRFGAVLEFSTLALIGLLLGVGLLLRRVWQVRSQA
ncbi:MAG TPA: YggT family protein [Roseiflexaceae bacterium]|nr:YggT family protein [Roseiflexaceae bacterium]